MQRLPITYILFLLHLIAEAKISTNMFYVAEKWSLIFLLPLAGFLWRRNVVGCCSWPFLFGFVLLATARASVGLTYAWLLQGWCFTLLEILSVPETASYISQKLSLTLLSFTAPVIKACLFHSGFL